MKRTIGKPSGGLLAFLLTVVGGCAATGSGRDAHLPFRVALIPIEIRYSGPSTAVREENAGLQLELDPEDLGLRVARVLGSRVFSDAVLLAPPPNGWSSLAERDEHWILEAASKKANLILECSVRVNPWVQTVRNDRFWMNMLLFLVGGPASWFVPDRSYLFEAQLSAQLHQLEPLRDGSATLADGRGRLAFAHAQAQEVELNLFDRAGGNLLPYLGSILVPASFLAAESGRAVGATNEAATALLASEIGGALAGLQHQIAFGGSVTDIVLPEDLEVTLTETNVELRGSALLRTRAATRLDGYEVSLGEQTVAGFFGEGATDPMLGDGRSEYLRYPFEAVLPRVEGADFLYLEVVAGGRDRSRRTFCVPLEW